MNYFLDIKSLFSSNKERSIEQLSKVYSDNKRLKAVIGELIGNRLSTEHFKGKKVLIKPNWVRHSIKISDEACLRTHDNFLLATLEIILEKKPISVLIGDAPIQGCRWNEMLSPEFSNSIQQLSKEYGIPVSIKDFRRVTFEPAKNNLTINRNPITDYLIFDVGKESFLEPISGSEKQLFRVTNYNPDRLGDSHNLGMHKYCITRELFDADIVISLPKVKTHQKTGITAALKNLVGINGDKDYLPHHRIGGTGFGGDCYPGKNYLRYWSELSLDFANRRQGKLLFWFGYKFSSLLWKLSLPGSKHHTAAAWHGNDTTWRMVLDLNKIAIYGKANGTLAKNPQRQLFSLCDGIIGGQGDGPLKPEPLPLGIISLTNHSAMNDISMATLMGFEISLIPMLKAVEKQSRIDNVELTWNNNFVRLKDLKIFNITTKAPPGWQEHLKHI